MKIQCTEQCVWNHKNLFQDMILHQKLLCTLIIKNLSKGECQKALSYLKECLFMFPAPQLNEVSWTELKNCIIATKIKVISSINFRLD
jgi:hypothetical protein